MSKIMQITSAVDFGSLHNAVVMINSETAVVGVYQDNHVVIELRSLGYELAIFQYSANTNVKIYLMGGDGNQTQHPGGTVQLKKNSKAYLRVYPSGAGWGKASGNKPYQESGQYQIKAKNGPKILTSIIFKVHPLPGQSLFGSY